MSTTQFDYSTAFNRNIGWISPDEQSLLRGKRVAIAGLGGVGGSHLLTLTRLGIGAFTLADFDAFELANFNRQAGASLSTLGKDKSAVLSERALDINPELDLRLFDSGVNDDNADEFLAGADLYLDALDFFALTARRTMFAACSRLGIPAVTAAPLGMGAALLNFLPGRMTFEEYFQLDGHDENEQLLRFLIGLSPAMLQGRYLVYPQAVRLAERRGPSTPMACELCAGAAGTEVLKILLGRGGIISAPRGVHYDAYRNRLAITWRPGGNRNPFQKLVLAIARRRYMTGMEPDEMLLDEQEATSNNSAVHQILDLARWAPSGDNAQPWSFEIEDDRHVVIHGRDTREHCVYDLRGRASQLALGTLLETLAIAASSHGIHADFSRRAGTPDTQSIIDITLSKVPGVQPAPLLPYIKTRMVNRRGLSTRALTAEDRSSLEAAAGEGYRIIWYSELGARLKIARLLFRNGKLRLHLPEAFETHRSVVEWNSRFSQTRIPEGAIGLDPLTLKLMKWAMQSWERVSFLNRYLGGSLLPRIELDLVPAIACAAHFAIIADTPPRSHDDHIEAGRAVQRFWLTASSLGLYLQPEMTPLIFDSYLRENITFTHDNASQRLARSLSGQLDRIMHPELPDHAVFMGRVGWGSQPTARSVRRPLEELLVKT